jgi:hypothetical protein
MKPAQPAAHKAPKGPSPEPKLLSPPPWRAVGVGIASLGTPVGIGVAHLVLGEIIAAVEVMVALTITGTALFGSQALSERAFRLLRWLGNRPEPPGPPGGSGHASVIAAISARPLAVPPERHTHQSERR